MLPKNKNQNLSKFVRQAALFSLVWLVWGVIFAYPHAVWAAITEKINYQGKLTDENNVTVADDAYDVVFKLYTVGGGADSPIWTESWTDAALWTEAATTTVTRNSVDCGGTGNTKIAYATEAKEASLAVGQYLWNTTFKEAAIIKSVDTSGNVVCVYNPYNTWIGTDDLTNRVYVRSGLFSVMLGSVASLSAVNFNQNLFLGVTMEEDAEMAPRKVIGAAPAAMESKKLEGATWAAPGSIGSGTPNAAAFTTLSSSGITQLATTAGSTFSLGNSTGAATLASGGASSWTNTSGNLTLATASSGDIILNPTGNVGIGITAPLAFLHIAAPTTAKAQLRLDEGVDPSTPAEGDFWYNGTNLYFKPSGAQKDLLASGGADNLGSHIMTQNLQTGGFWISNDGGDEGLWVKSDGNVGIGTTAPGYKLDVNGNASFGISALPYSQYATLMLSERPADDDCASFIMSPYSSSRGYTFDTHDNGSAYHFAIYDRVANKDRFYIDSNGDVGLGDGSTDARLNIKAGGTGTDFTLKTQDSNGVDKFVILDNGYVGIGTTSPGEKITIYGDNTALKFIAASDSDYQVMLEANYSFTNPMTLSGYQGYPILKTLSGFDKLIFYTGDSERMTIDNTDGFIGIGTTDPGYKLAVEGDTNINGDLYIYDNNVLLNSGTTLEVNHNSYNDTLSFFTSDTEQMRINSSGNVGIGTTDPNEKLDVNGRIYLADSSAPGTTTNRLYSVGGDLYWDGSKVSTDASIQKIRLSGDYTNTTTSFSDIDDDATGTSDLAVTIGAYETWIVEFQIQYNSNTTADGRWSLVGQTGANCALGMQEIENGAQTTSNISCGADTLFGSVAGDDTFNIYGTIVNGDTPGPFQLQYRQSAASGTSTIYEGSYVKAYRIDGADLAEVYYSDVGMMAQGTIVSLNPDKTNFVIASENDYDQKALGVVSTRPGVVIGEVDGDFDIPIMVALAGRVPVLVSSENGPIQVGDRIASSGSSGVGMKAVLPGQTVGVALEPFDPEDSDDFVACPAGFSSDYKCGKIMMFVQNQWHDPTIVSTDLGLAYNRQDAIGKYGKLESEIIETNGLFINGKQIDQYINEAIVNEADLSDALLQGNSLALSNVDLKLNILEQELENQEKLTANFSALLIEGMKEQQDIVRILELLLTQKENNFTKLSLSEISTDRLAAGLETITPTLVADKVETDTIASSTGEDINILLGENGTFTIDGPIVTNEDSTTTSSPAVTIDNQGNAIFLGALTVDVIAANKILGLEIYTNQLSGIDENVSALGDKLNALQTTEENIDLSILGILEKKGGLAIAKETTFKEAVVFEKIVTLLGNMIFRGEVSFEKVPTFNKDTAGYALIKEGQKTVAVTFERKYPVVPIINASLSLQQIADEEVRKAAEELLLVSDVQFIITNATTKGFEIRINQQALSDMPFSWQAIAVKDAQTFESVMSGANEEITPLADIVPVPNIITNLEPSGTASSVSTGEITDETAREILPAGDELSVILPETPPQ